MKLKKGFILREVAGSYIVVPTGAELNFNGMITLNETGRTLWLALEQETDLAGLTGALLAEYDVDEETAADGAERFVNNLREHGFLDE